MIYLIMVFSAIMLPSCTTMDPSSHLSLDTILNINTSSSRRPADDSNGRVVAPLSLSLQTQLGPNDLGLSSVTPKGNLGHISSNGLSRVYVKRIPLSKSFRRRRRYQKDQEKRQDDANTRIRQPLERAMVGPLSLKLYHKLPYILQLAQRAVLKRKRTSFRNHARNHDSTSNNAPGIISQEKKGKVSTVTDNKFSNGNNANKDHKRGDLDKENNLLKIASNVGDNSHIKNVPVSKRTTLVIHASSDKVKRSTSRERTGLDDASEIYVAGDNKTNPNISIRNSTRSDEDDTSLDIGSSKVSNASSKNNVTTTRRGKRRRRGRRRHRQSKDLALWIDERQVKLFSGYMMEIYAIHDGRVLPYILDPNFEKHLPVIPFEVQSVNFTWQAGRKRYYYTFDRLFSQDESILKNPVVSLPTQGRVPRKPKVFTVNIHCTGNASGIASFDIGLLIQTRRGKPMPGTPLRIKLRKECTQPSPDPECDEKCENGGVCDAGRRCQCPEGYMGQYCNTALCYPQCMNGGFCNTPGRCTCPPGYQGRHCEGGICRDKCENGGKCIQKDTCACSRGYYGNRCEFSKCVIPCINGGRCRNVNKCRCPHGFSGDHCEIVTGRNLAATALSRCSRKCRHGSCRGITCHCQQGFTGRWCRRRGSKRKRVWL